MRNVWIENLQYVDDCNLCVCKYVKRFQDLFETFQRRASSFEQKGLGGFGVMIRLAGDRQRILFHIEFRVVISTPPSRGASWASISTHQAVLSYIQPFILSSS